MNRLPSLVSPFMATKTVPGRTAGIVFHTGNGRISALGENLGTLQELLECHWS